MISAFLTVESLCAITITVLSFLRISRDLWMAASVSLSTDEVASSKIRISGFLRIALAIDILCLCPPESFWPLSPTIVFSFWGKLFINSSASDFCAAFHTSLSEAFKSP